MAQPNYYDLLECKRDATREEIKKNYLKLVLEHHPDKRNCGGEAADGAPSEAFVLLTKAWKILSDAALRRGYDARLFQGDLQAKPSVYDEVKIADLPKDADSNSYYVCRCGNLLYFAPDSSPGASPFLADCDQCSHVISVEP